MCVCVCACVCVCVCVCARARAWNGFSRKDVISLQDAQNTVGSSYLETTQSYLQIVL